MHAGETANLFTRFVRKPESLCSCRAHATECPVWAPALAAARTDASFHEWDAAKAIVAIVQRGEAPTPALTRACSTVLHEAARLTEAQTLVDSSNWPAYGAMLHAVAGGRVSYIHLVRDPRAAIHSRTRRGVRRRLRGRSSARVVGSVVHDSHRWNQWNREAAALAGLGAPFVTIRYEDLVDDPHEVLAHATNTLGLPELDVTHGSVERSRLHVIWGNRGAVAGKTELVADDRWQTESPKYRQRLCGLLTIRQRRVHGY